MRDDEISPLEIAYQPVSVLSESPNNARTHSTQQIRQIAASIRAFGFTNPVLIDKQRFIIAGHGRVRAANLDLLPLGD